MRIEGNTEKKRSEIEVRSCGLRGNTEKKQSEIEVRSCE